MPIDRPALTPATIVRRSDNQVSCRVDDETVLMHIETGEYFGYDAIGTRVWSLLEKPIDVSALCERLVAEHEDVDLDRCTEDVLAFLTELIGEGLLIPVQGGTNSP